MPSIRDLYTYYLTAEQLLGKSHVVHIAICTVEELWNRQTKRKEHKLVLRFHGKKLALVCNKTQAAALERITGSDDFSKWVGHTVTLSPGKAPTGADTIVITPALASTPNGHVSGSAKAHAPAVASASTAPLNPASDASPAPVASNGHPDDREGQSATTTPTEIPDAGNAGSNQQEAPDHAPTKPVRPARPQPAA